jgi:hypothetical protein
VARGFLLGGGGDGLVGPFGWVNVCAMTQGAMTAAEIVTAVTSAMRRSINSVWTLRHFMRSRLSLTT